MRIALLVAIALTFASGCGMAASIAEQSGLGATAEERADNERIRALIPQIAAACEISTGRMESFARELHDTVTGNRVPDTYVVTVESYHDAVRGALRAQLRHEFDRNPQATCQQVAEDYAFSRPRDWRLRRQPASKTVASIVRMIEQESQGWHVRRIY